MTYEVLINDSGSKNYENNFDYFHERAVWASENCDSYVGIHIQDVSDVSLQWDEIAAYNFTDEKDQILFMLRWL